MKPKTLNGSLATLKARTTSSQPSVADTNHMRHALGLASRGLGTVAPNPAVGCVIVKDGFVIGHGWTQPGGRPHAETEAINQAGEATKGATAYVTLEPCAHQGKTPPCADALIAAGIAHIHVAIEDPDPRTAGQGIEKLRAASIRVDVGLCEIEAAFLNRGFISKISRERPWVTLKLATSFDGMIAWSSGTPQWVTSPASRDRGHMMRARYDTLISGIGTVLADDPAFTCRLPGLEGRTPQRVVFDRQGRTPAGGKLIASADRGEIFIVTTEQGNVALGDVMNVLGEDAIKTMDDDDIDIEKVLRAMTKFYGTTRVMVECGAALATSFLAGNHVDEIAWFKAPSILGKEGITALNGLTIEEALADGGFNPVDSLKIGEDVLETFVKAAY